MLVQVKELKATTHPDDWIWRSESHDVLCFRAAGHLSDMKKILVLLEGLFL